jgi:hypothetical protein
MQELTTVDLNGFHTFRLRPDQAYISLDPESQEEDNHLKALLNVDNSFKGKEK